MILIVYFVFITQIFFSTTNPIEGGFDVGKVENRKGKNVVINPGDFGYLAHLEFVTLIPGKIKKKLIEVRGNCGGVLIKKDVILTAAHCIEYPDKTKKITAWLGVLDTEFEKGRGQPIPVRGFTIHGAFIRSNEDLGLNFVNDIALLFLQKPAVLDYKSVKLVKLPNEYFDAVNKVGWVAGWGVASCGKSKSMLQKAQVKGVSFTNCQTYYKTTKIPFTFICAISENKEATITHGDSGGPFVIGDTILGISSFGPIKEGKTKEEDVCDPTKPAVYTYVPKYVQWIEASSKEEPDVLIIKPTPTKRSIPPRKISAP